MRSRLLLVLLAACEGDKQIPPIPWTIDTMPDRRLEAAAAAVGTQLVVYGGFVTGEGEVPPLEITNEVFSFNTLTEFWTILPPAPVALTHANLAGAGGAVFLLGGLEGNTFEARGDSFVLESGAAAWTPLPAMPAKQERGASAVVVAPGHVFLLGGACRATTPACSESTGGSGYFANTLDFDLATRTWSILAIPDIPGGRSHAAAMRETDGTFTIAGGENQDGALAFTNQLAFGGTEWKQFALMPTRRSGCAYGVVFGQLICAGGDNGTEVLDAVESYDPTLDRWTVRPPMIEPRAGARGAAVASRLYVPGGTPVFAFQPTDTLLVFNPLVPDDVAEP